MLYHPQTILYFAHKNKQFDPSIKWPWRRTCRRIPIPRILGPCDISIYIQYGRRNPGIGTQWYVLVKGPKYRCWPYPGWEAKSTECRVYTWLKDDTFYKAQRTFRRQLYQGCYHTGKKRGKFNMKPIMFHSLNMNYRHWTPLHSPYLQVKSVLWDNFRILSDGAKQARLYERVIHICYLSEKN